MGLPIIHLARHGETEWALAGRHTGRTDIELTLKGELDAGFLGKRLQGLGWGLVLTSPSVRARRTAEISGYGLMAQVEADLAEWDYGQFEGKTSAEIRAEHPGWVVFRDGAPGGESVADVSARADRVIARLKASQEDVVVFSSGHFLRALAARWCGQDVAFGSCLALGTASVSALGYDHDLTEPVIRLWNDTRHLDR